MNLEKEIKKLAEKYFNEIVNIRQYLHKYPELSFNEDKTSEFIASKLTEFNIPFKSGYAKNGILAEIEGKNPDSRTIALRADMDALPITERNSVEYKSVNKDVMHACGHDVHMASMLGTAKILNNLRKHFDGTILIVFQPAEEKLPGGAKIMLDEGIFEKKEPDVVIAQHVFPDMNVGSVGFREGMYMASSDEIYITVKGKGGHAAMPEKITNTVLIASEIIVNLHKEINNTCNKIPTVLNFGKVIAQGATNVIPNEVFIEGTFRTMNEEWRAEVHKKIVNISKTIAEKSKGNCVVDIKKGYPFLINDVDVTMKAKILAKKFLGENKVEDMDIRMTAEDFAFFSQKYPSTFYRLGTASGNNFTKTLHSSDFNIDENAILVGMGTMAYIAMNI
ncbi:MAG: M20 family metallopeptidase [Bacteroidales bacterium]|jgi:amidohydrolase|nr:M20 family metallopeptidase [Bacteroidales bacterium]